MEGLIELFPAAEGLVREAAPSNYTMLFEDYAKTLGSPSPMGERPIVATEAHFIERFNARHRDVLSRLREVRSTRSCGWFVAGGSVLGALLQRSTPAASWAASDSDVDIFVFARAGSADERQGLASRLARRIFDALARDDEMWHVNRSRFVINLRRGLEVGEPPVQIVLRLYDSPTEVLLGFDVDCCCVGYDGQHVYALPRVRALPCTALHRPTLLCPALPYHHPATALPPQPLLHRPSCANRCAGPSRVASRLRRVQPVALLAQPADVRAAPRQVRIARLRCGRAGTQPRGRQRAARHHRSGAAEAARGGAAATAARRATDAPQAVGAVGQVNADAPRDVRAGLPLLRVRAGGIRPGAVT